MSEGQIIYLEKLEDMAKHFKFNRYPDRCPMCHYSVKPDGIFLYKLGMNYGNNFDNIEVICRCPNSNCKELFIAYYGKHITEIFQDYDYRGCSPYRYEKVEFEKVIEEISPSFVEIYSQANRAEQLKLNEICGVGYRKALEFLVKDYLINLMPVDTDNIKKMPLIRCIKENISDTRLKMCAERATWLGNDETHYIRKWEEKDIEDLKNLIQLTVLWISIEKLTNQYIEDMPNGKK